MTKVSVVKDQEKWDLFVAQTPSFGLFQSWQWGEFKQKMGWLAYRIAVEEQGEIIAGAQMLIKSLPAGIVSIAYIPRGPLCDWFDRETTLLLLDGLHRIARQHRAIFLKIEPPLVNSVENSQILEEYSFLASRRKNQPRNTIIVNLDQDLEFVLSQMRKKTRKYILRSKRQGVRITIGDRDSLPAFHRLMQETAKRGKFVVQSLDYFESKWEAFSKLDQCVLLLAWHGKELLAGDMTFRFGAHAADFYGGSLKIHPDLHLDYLLIWEAINWAKSKGCVTFDLWGIPDDVNGIFEEDKRLFVHRKNGLWGVYQFKSGFSQNVVSYVGPYDYPYSPILYAILSRIFFSENFLDKIVGWLQSLSRQKAFN